MLFRVKAFPVNEVIRVAMYLSGIEDGMHFVFIVILDFDDGVISSGQERALCIGLLLAYLEGSQELVVQFSGASAGLEMLCREQHILA